MKTWLKQYEPSDGTKLADISENLFNKVINEITDYAIFLLDIDGKIMTWNEGCIIIKQFVAEDVIGKFYGMLFTEEEQEKGIPLAEIEKAKIQGRMEAEAWRRKKDGSRFWANVVLTAINDENNHPIGFIKITKDLTERKLYEEKLKKKNEQLTKTNQDLDNFVYTASHDLKTPILNIDALVHNLEYGMKEADFNVFKKYLSESVIRFRKTIDDLTNITKIQNQWEEEQAENIDIQEIIDDIKGSLNSSLEEVCPDLQYQLKVKNIHFPKASFRSILLNMITNAIKYRNPLNSCNITISTYYNKGYMVLSVKDNGIGMKEGYREKLFRMFRRLHDHVEGTGVGLYLVKRIVDNANGHIEVESKVDVGTEFKIYLPVE